MLYRNQVNDTYCILNKIYKKLIKETYQINDSVIKSVTICCKIYLIHFTSVSLNLLFKISSIWL